MLSEKRCSFQCSRAQMLEEAERVNNDALVCADPRRRPIFNEIKDALSKKVCNCGQCNGKCNCADCKGNEIPSFYL